MDTLKMEILSMFVDSHAHLTCDPLFSEISDILARAKEASVDTVITIAIDRESLQRALDFQTNQVAFYVTGATTPHDVEELGERDFPHFEKAAKEGKLVAVGETGLDYYYTHSNKKAQKAYFSKYIALAKECDLPLVIHCRDAFEDFYKMMDSEYGNERVIMHCFTGTEAEAKQALDRGYLISFSGIVTFKKSNALREVAKMVPLDRLLIETDSPYLAPQSKRGKPCEPAYVVETAECIAKVKGVSLEEVATSAKSNLQRLLRL